MKRFYGKIKDGKVVFSPQTRGLMDEYTSCKFKDEESVVVTISKPDKNTTVEQYRYLYACVYEPLADQLGYTVDEIDEMLKYKFLVKFKGTPHEFLIGKSELSREEMAKYIDHCIQFAAEAGVICQII